MLLVVQQQLEGTRLKKAIYMEWSDTQEAALFQGRHFVQPAKPCLSSSFEVDLKFQTVKIKSIKSKTSPIK